MITPYKVNDIKKAIDTEELTGLLKKLIAIESHAGVPECEEKIAVFLHDYLLSNGIKSRLVLVKPHRYNLVALLKGSSSNAFMLTGHLDTVGDYGVPGLFTPHEADGKIYGRGACDMKGPIASMVEAAITLKRLSIPLPCDLKLAFVVDEEFKSFGTENLIESGEKANAAILGEPTNLSVCAGNRGLEWININVHGRQTHGGTPEKGINAIVMASRLIERINRDLVPRISEHSQPILGKAIMNFGMIKGGFQPSSVPSECLIKIDRRWIKGESVKEIYSGFQKIIDALKDEDQNFSATLSRDTTNMNKMEHGPVCLETSHPLIKLLCESNAAVTGKKADIHAFPGWTDASLLSNFGHIPTAIFGPGDIACAHSERECVDISQLKDAAMIYALAAMNFKSC